LYRRPGVFSGMEPRAQMKDRAEQCLDNAEACAARAATAHDRDAKAAFAEAAKMWRHLARLLLP
jgi:hypothetical protein